MQVRFTCADGERLQFDVERRLCIARSFSLTPGLEKLRELVNRKDALLGVPRDQLGRHAIEESEVVGFLCLTQAPDTKLAD